MNRTRILVCHPSIELYGADRILAHCVNSFPPGCEVVVALPGAGPLVAHLKDAFRQSNARARVEIVPDLPILARRFLKPSGLFALVLRLCAFRAWIRSQDPFDAGYFNTQATTFCLVASVGLVPRRVVHVHEILERPRFIARILATIDSLFAHGVVHVSKAVRDNFLEQSFLPRPGDSVVCHNGIPEPVAQSEVRDVRGSRLVCVLFGRIMPEKGQWFLLDALAHLDASTRGRLDVRMFGGPAPGREYLVDELRAAIVCRNLENVVKVHAFIADVADELALADIVLVPSMMRDPFPTTVLEGMAAAKCVVTTNHGGAAEVVEHGRTGLLVKPGESETLASLLTTLANNPAYCGKMGTKARETYLSDYTLEAFRDRFRAAIEVPLLGTVQAQIDRRSSPHE